MLDNIKNIYLKTAPIIPTRPPHGLVPRYIVTEQRLDDIINAIHRYLEVKMVIPVEWLSEYNFILKEIYGKH